MSRLKAIALGALALVATGIVAVPTASASFEVTTKQCGTGIPTLCMELEGKLFEAKGTEKYTGKLVSGTHINFTIPSLEIEITCGKDLSTGEILQTNPGVEAVTGVGTLLLSECKLLGALGKKCRVPAEKETLKLLGTVIDEMPVDAGIVKPQTGTVFIEVPFENNGTETCPATLKGTHKITGEDLCLAAESEVEKVVHSGECTKAGSKLTFSEDPADFESKSEVELNGASKGKTWDVSLA